MALFCAAIRRDSVSLISFLFVRHVQVFSCEMSFFSRLKCPYCCFSFHFCFLVIFVLLMLVLSVLFLVAVISLPPPFFIWSSRRCINALTSSWILASPLPPSFLCTVCLHHLWDVRQNHVWYFSSKVDHGSSSFVYFLFSLSCLRNTTLRWKRSLIYTIIFTQPLRSGRIWHKVNFLSGV